MRWYGQERTTDDERRDRICKLGCGLLDMRIDVSAEHREGQRYVALGSVPMPLFQQSDVLPRRIENLQPRCLFHPFSSINHDVKARQN
jgi:hypothetical protein